MKNFLDFFLLPILHQFNVLQLQINFNKNFGHFEILFYSKWQFFPNVDLGYFKICSRVAIGTINAMLIDQFGIHRQKSALTILLRMYYLNVLSTIVHYSYKGNYG